MDVDRAGSPAGPWERIADSLVDAYHYLDDKFNLPPPPKPRDRHDGVTLFSLSRDIYYRVSITPPSGTAFMSRATVIEPELDRRTRLLKRRIQFEEAVVFRAVNGVPLAILKRKRWGPKCRMCYDPVTREATKEHCPSCYGTAFEGGYWAPVITRGRRTPAPVQTQISPHGESEVRMPSFIILDYPHLEYKDIIVELRSNKRYQVQVVTMTELRGVIVHQTSTVSELSRNSVEYSILVDPLATPPLY